MASKRLIRFSRGQLAGQFRYVSPRSGCAQGPSEPTAPTGPTDAAEAFATAPEPAAATPASESKCGSSESAARQSSVIPPGTPTFTPQDIQRAKLFKLAHPTDPFTRIARFNAALLALGAGLTFGWTTNIEQVQNQLLGRSLQPFVPSPALTIPTVPTVETLP